MKKGILVAIVLVGVVGAAWYFFSGPTIKNYPPQGDTIVAFGDSLVQGVGATEGNDFVSVLAREIGKPIVNVGKSGDTTAMALARIDQALQHDPDIVLVLLGGNDYLRRVPKEETFANLGQIVTKFQEKGAVVLVLGVRGGLLRDNYEAQFKQFAKKYETAYVPNVLDGLIGTQTYMSDTIHPNDRGYVLVAEKVQSVLEDFLSR